MKILIASIQYPGKIGVSTYIEQLVHGLKKQGHLVDLFYNKASLKNARNPHASLDQMVASYQKEASRLPIQKYDIIHSQGIIPAVALSQIKPKHIPLVTSLHGALAFNLLLNGALKINTPSWRQNLSMESKAITSSDICIVGSQWLKNVFLKEYKINASQKFAIIPYGIDIEEFVGKMQGPASIPKPPDKFVIACTARLVPLKGHQFLLKALSSLKKQRNDWVCWLIGGGPLLNSLNQQAAKLGIANKIKFLGSQGNVAALLKNADIFVFPSLQDNFPYAVMEAQIAGVPVAASDAGGLPEMITNGITGLISPKKDFNSLYLNLMTLMEKKTLRESLANNAYHYAIDNWNLKKMIDSTIAVYQQAFKIENK